MIGTILLSIGLSISACVVGNCQSGQNTNIMALKCDEVREEEPMRIDSSSATSRLTYYYYFEYLTSHATNDNGICPIIASDIMLTYYDTFVSDEFVPEEYEFVSKYDNDVGTYYPSPRSGIGLNRPLVDELIDICDDLGYYEIHSGNGMSSLHTSYVIDNYLYNHNISATVNHSYFLTQLMIKDAIDNDEPVIVESSTHMMVAYAYNDLYVWVHNGLGSCSVKTWGELTGASCGWITIDFTGTHVCSDNYYNPNTNRFYCPIHGANRYGADITPVDYGYEQQYYFYVKYKNFSKNGLSISTQRYRCGYIEQEKINLSPKRLGAGSANIIVNYGVPMKRIFMDLSYWQILDVLDPNNSTARLIFFTTDDYWERNLNLLSMNLPDNRAYQKTYSFSFNLDDEVCGFMILMTSPAVGDRNLGRISIGDILVEY